MRLPALVAVLLLPGCTPAPQLYAGACATPPPHWRTPEDGIGHLRYFNLVEMDKAGAIRWNRVVVNTATLDRYLRLSGELDPQPQILLTIDPAAECGSVKQLRARMDRTRICSADRLCGEGKDWSLASGPSI